MIKIAATALALTFAGCTSHPNTDGGQSPDAGCILDSTGCRLCAPTPSSVPDGTPCVVPSQGAVCIAGSCLSGCFIDGGFFGPGSVNPANSCQSCSIESTSQWATQLPGSPCLGGYICAPSGACEPPPNCTVGSVVIPNRASNPADPSLCCNSALDPNGWSPRLVPAQGYLSKGGCGDLLITGDFNGDGWLDLAQVSNSCGSPAGWKILTLMNHQGVWELGPSYGSGRGNIYGTIAVDLDRDGYTDLVTADGTTISVRRSPGANDDAGYPSVEYPSGPCSSLIPGDFNDDGVTDLVCCTGRMLFFEGIGDGGLAPFTEILGGAGSAEAVAADFNGDGISDVAFVVGSPVGVGPAGITILLGSGGSPFLDGGSYYYAPARSGDRFGFVSPGDLDGDGSQDLALEFQVSSSSPTSYRLLILPGLGDGTFGPWQTLPLPGHVISLTHADLDLDGRAELVLSVQASTDGGTHVPVLYALDLADGGSLQAVLRPSGELYLLTSGDFKHNQAPGMAALTAGPPGMELLAPYDNGCP